MAFVKLDKGILQSSIWMDRPAREVFITALLMAEPTTLEARTPTIQTRTLDPGDYHIPAGNYGFVAAASVGIIRQAGIEREVGLAALERLATGEDESRSREHGGRRLVRIDGGFIVLNYDLYRRKDHTAAERMRRYRERQKEGVTALPTVTGRNVTHEDEHEDEHEDKETAADAAVTASSALRDRFPEQYRDAYDGYITAARNPKALRASLQSLHDGLQGPAYSWDTLGQALHEMAVAGASGTVSAIRGFCRKLAEAPRPTTKGAGFDGTSAEE